MGTVGTVSVDGGTFWFVVRSYRQEIEDWGGGIASQDEVEAVFRSHSGQVWRAVLAMTAGRSEIADEATSEAFARLFVHREEVRDPVAWVFRTAFRIAVGETRRERATGDRFPAVEAASDRSALPEDLTAALLELSSDQRAVVFLHYFADLPLRDVAHLMGTPLATTKVRLHRARKSLRITLKETRSGFAG
jgi:RNA polymerase sigma-70 factor (ECF subfamily)